MMERLKNLKTTAMGLVIFALGTFLFYSGKIEVLQYATLAVLAWVFVAAKDTILEGITGGLFKTTPPKDELPPAL